MISGRIKKFKVPEENNIENFMREINIKRNEYISGNDVIDIENINLTSEVIIDLLKFLNESYSNILYLLCQEGFDIFFNYIRICNDFEENEQEKIFSNISVLTEKSIDIFKNYIKCIEESLKSFDDCNLTPIPESNKLKNLFDNNNIMNKVTKCIEDNYINYCSDKKINKTVTAFEINEILISYFNVLTFFYLNLFNNYCNNFNKPTNTELLVTSGQRGRKKQKKDSEIENSINLKNINRLLSNIISLMCSINFEIFFNKIQIYILDIYLHFFLNIYIINQENNYIFNINEYKDQISINIETLLRLYIKSEDELRYMKMKENEIKCEEYEKKDIENDDGNENHNQVNSDSSPSLDKPEKKKKDNKQSIIDYTNLKNEKISKYDSYFYSFSFTYIIMNVCNKCTNVTLSDFLLRLRNTIIPAVIIEEFINYIKESALKCLNLNMQTHLQNELINLLNFMEYFSKNLSYHLLVHINELIDMLGIDINYIRKSIIDILKNFLILAKLGEELIENTLENNKYINEKRKSLLDDESSNFSKSDENNDENEKENLKEKKKKNDKNKTLKNINIQFNEKIFSNYKDVINKILIDDISFLQSCFEQCIRNRQNIMRILISRQYDYKLHVRCHLLKIFQELIEGNYIPLIYYNDLCFISKERINDKSPLVRQKAFCLLSAIATDVVKNKYIISLDTEKIKKELSILNKSIDYMDKKYENNDTKNSFIKKHNEINKIDLEKKNIEENNEIKKKKRGRKKKIQTAEQNLQIINNIKRKSYLSDSSSNSNNNNNNNNNSSSNNSSSSESFLSDNGHYIKSKKKENYNHILNNYTSKKEETNVKEADKINQNKIEILIKMYNEVLFISLIVDECVKLCFKLLYSVVETDQKSAIRFLILAHLCGNRLAEKNMNKVWGLIFSNNSSIVEMIINEFTNVNIVDDYRISTFRLINVILNSNLNDLSCIEKIIECLLMQEKPSININKLLDELFNIIFVETFSENKNMLVKEGALILMRVIFSSVHYVNIKKGKKEQYFVFSNKRKHYVILFINEHKKNFHFINLLILILKYNKTNKTIQSLLIILFNLIFDNIFDISNDENNILKQNDENNLNNKYLETNIIQNLYLYNNKNIWFKSAQSLIESMFEHFEEFIAIFTTKLKSIFKIIFGTINDVDTSTNKKKKLSCYSLSKIIFIFGHLGLYTYIYAEKIQNKLKKITIKTENFGMCTKEEKDREYFEYVVENMIVCNNLLGKKIVSLIFLILRNPKIFFKEYLIIDNLNGSLYNSNKDLDTRIYTSYEIYILILTCLLAICKFSIISQTFCQILVTKKKTIIQLIVSIIINEKYNCEKNEKIEKIENDDDDDFTYLLNSLNIEEIVHSKCDIIFESIEKKKCIDNINDKKKENKTNKDIYDDGIYCQAFINEIKLNIQNKILEKSIINMRKMLLISYADLLYRHPNTLEPHNIKIFNVLSDEDVIIRRTAVSVFTHLYMTDTVKAKSILLMQMMYLTIDKDEKINSGSRSFFYELDRKSHNTLGNNICDMISVLALNEKNLTYEMNKEILEFLLSFMRKSKYNEALVEKVFKKMKEINSDKKDALNLFMQVFLNIHIDEKILSKINKCFHLIRYVIKENEYVLDNFVYICKKASEKKRGRPTEEIHQNATEKTNKDKTETEKHDSKMKELAEDLLSKIESTTSKSKNIWTTDNVSSSLKKSLSKGKENDLNQSKNE